MNHYDQYRIEKDTLGEISVPITAYYGAQTQRAVNNFQISGIRLPRSFIRAQGIIKAAAAAANMELGLLSGDIGKVVIEAAEEVIAGKWDAHFVVDIYQAGAGTSQNMNVNEVIANRAAEISGAPLSSHPIHPNDHVNMSQSTNDTFHAAINIAAAENIVHRLLPALTNLQQELDQKAAVLMPILKSGRTHLHDAVPIRLGQEFSGYGETIHTTSRHLEQATDALYEIGLGGNAIGTKNNVNPAYIPKIIDEVRDRTGLPFRQPVNIFQFMQNTAAPIRTMLVLKELAVHLIKITSDLRLLSSGPRTGLAEIILPPVQPGSTIMPGKINPAILEMTHMVCCQVIGYEAAVATAGISGQLEINVMMPVVAYTLLQSIDILANAVATLTAKCINGIEANEHICRHWMEASLGLVTGLSPILGYDLASTIGKLADEQNKTIKQILQEKGLFTVETEKALHPEEML
ncbi:fumarate hydratase, class II [Evansella caseinilytica]|uniref:Fumarate hydratase, class II n=1 Tax=Evansella caseinilytica TaxID=1503961 RepID=A0A1H3PEN8_9BACI|nr:aspartate ammonia-lyase [Evansella caseinilytica]SDY99413.1 fumarate hydratase, class II [Evansella caseinilytica]